MIQRTKYAQQPHYRWLGPLNYFFLQFLCIRLAYERHVTEIKLHSISLVEDGGYSMGGHSVKEKHVFLIMYWVKPLTGWEAKPYKYWGKCRYLYLSRRKE